METVKNEAVRNANTSLWETLIKKYVLFAEQLKLFDEMIQAKGAGKR